MKMTIILALLFGCSSEPKCNYTAEMFLAQTPDYYTVVDCCSEDANSPDVRMYEICSGELVCLKSPPPIRCGESNITNSRRPTENGPKKPNETR